MAKLFDLLTELEKKELNVLKNYIPYINDLDDEIIVKNMTIEQLRKIAMILIETEYNGKVPKCVLSAEAINILTNRAIKKAISIY